MSKFDLVVKNGIIVTSGDTFVSDIGIKDGIILELGKNLSCDNIYDANFNFVFPGGIDVHTHIDMPFGGTFTNDDFISGTKAAAIGGTTTIIDYAVQSNNKTLKETIDIWNKKAINKAVIDYGFHLGVTKLDDITRKELPELLRNGFSSFKVFMVYDGMKLSDGEIMEILEIAKTNNGLVCVHAENYDSINFLTKKLLDENKIEPIYHAYSRPQECEAEATNRVIKLAEMINSPVYIVHVSNQEAADSIKRSRNKGFKTFGETCPQYLLLNINHYNEPDFGGAKYVMSPPLREKYNNELLWNSIRDGVLSTIATDHCPFTTEQKKLGINSFTKIPNGAPGIELRMSLIYNYGVNNKHINVNKFVEVTSTNPAKIFGMYPKKGTIAVNSDADFVIFDKDKELDVNMNIVHENVDYTPYEGLKLKGYPIATFSRGELIAKDGTYIGSESRGQLIKRGVPILD